MLGAPREGQGDPGESKGAPGSPGYPFPGFPLGPPDPPWVPLASLELHQTTSLRGLLKIRRGLWPQGV